MGRIYTVPYQGSVTNAGGDADLFEISPAANKPIRLRGLVLAQTSEVGDAAEENVRIAIMRLPATVTSGNGTSVTPVPTDDNDVAAGFTAEANGATLATTSGSAVTVEEFAWNLRASPCERWWPDERFAPRCQNAAALIVRLHSTVLDDVSVAITAYVEEL